MDNEKFGRFIKNLRKQKNMTQKELAEKLNITDKAVSKWERGLSFPDITILNLISDIFGITVSELLNAEIGKNEEVDIEKAIQEAVEKITHKEEKKQQKIKKIQKNIEIISMVLFIFSSIIQLGYIFLVKILLKNYNYEYIIDSLFYIINETILLSGVTFSMLLIHKSKLKNKKITNICIILVFTILTIMNISFMCNNGLKNESTITFSKDFSNVVILKKDKNTGETIFYRDLKAFIFARKKERFSYEVEGKIKTQWLTTDICSVTYTDKDSQIREFIATFGDRSDGSSYYNVEPALEGEWMTDATQYEKGTTVLVDSKGITITKSGNSELFEHNNCKQFGTIAVVLYDEKSPRYVIALNKDCELDEKTNIIKDGGTITLCEVSMKKTKSEILHCITSKKNMRNYRIVDLKENEYIIKNGILYISYDGINIIEVPGEFSKAQNNYNDYNYQISKEKTAFFYIIDKKKYLVYSDNMGRDWQTVEIENDSWIKSLQFVNSDVGYMFSFQDIATGIAIGKISKTTDGGKSWKDIFYGFGEYEFERTFSEASEIKFIDENIGYLTMPRINGEYSDLYETRDGGYTFSKVNIIENGIYDYYNLPMQKDGKLYLEIAESIYGDYKTYCSEDNGYSWKLDSNT